MSPWSSEGRSSELEEEVLVRLESRVDEVEVVLDVVEGDLTSPPTCENMEVESFQTISSEFRRLVAEEEEEVEELTSSSSLLRRLSVISSLYFQTYHHLSLRKTQRLIFVKFEREK